MTTTEYVIRDRAGVHRATHVRYDGPAGKRFAWKRPDGSTGLNGTPVADLPLYGIHHAGEWTDATTIVVAEGEKATMALLGRHVPAVGHVAGAAVTPSAKTLADLAGRHVTLWPDADEAGQRLMAAIAEALCGVATTVRLVTPPGGAEKGWDAADAVAAGIDPRDLLDAAELVGPTFVRLPPEDAEPTPPRLLAPLICDSRTMWFGAQGAGKGVLLVVATAALAEGDAAYIPGCSVERPLRVGVIDWEDNQDEIAERLQRMAVRPRSVPYLAPVGPLTNAKVLANVRHWVNGEGVELVAVDSVIPAAGGSDAMKPEAPTAYYQALRELDRPSLSLAHVPKDKAQAPHPFGSTYWSAPIRLAWRVENPGDDGRHIVRLVNTKHSRWPWATEFMLEVGWAGPGPLRLRSAINLALEKDVAPLIDRVILALRMADKPLSAEELAERTGATAQTVRVTLGRHPHRVVDDGGRPALFRPREDIP